MLCRCRALLTNTKQLLGCQLLFASRAAQFLTDSTTKSLKENKFSAKHINFPIPYGSQPHGSGIFTGMWLHGEDRIIEM